MQIRAAVLERFAEPLEVQEVELAPPRRGEVLVRLKACGICHTDMYSASGVDPSGYAPCVLGHEGAGVVEEVGEGVAVGVATSGEAIGPLRSARRLFRLADAAQYRAKALRAAHPVVAGRHAPQGDQPSHQLRIRPVFAAFGNRHQLFPERAMVASVLAT